MRNIVKACGLGLVAMAAACGSPEMSEEEEIADPVDEATAAAVEGSLSAFEADPNTFLNTLPAKLQAPTVNLFTDADIASRAFVTAKDTTRSDPDPKADAWGSNDWARNLVDDYSITRLADMSRYKKVTLAESPWSDDYWALYAGSIAKRYADPALPSGSDWKVITDYIRTKQPANTDNLSPAEKYDLLVGDANKTMTKFNLDTEKDYFATYNKVET
jgi:hypothetical protein